MASVFEPLFKEGGRPNAPLRVQKMGYVYLSDDRNYYSVPFRYIGQQVEVQYCSDMVQVFHEPQRIATHKRNYRKGYFTTIEEHLANSHKFYTQWKPEYFLERANDIGGHAYEFVSLLLANAKYPKIAYKSALGVIHLKSRYLGQSIDNACKIAVENGLGRYMNIKNILGNNADLKSDDAPGPKIPEHDNKRRDIIERFKSRIKINSRNTIEKMKQMRLKGIAEYHYQTTRNKLHQEYTTDQYLALLVDMEWEYRQNRKMGTLIKAAGFKISAGINDIDYSSSRNLDRNYFERLASFNFMENKENIIITGATGTGNVNPL